MVLIKTTDRVKTAKKVTTERRLTQVFNSDRRAYGNTAQTKFTFEKVDIIKYIAMTLNCYDTATAITTNSNALFVYHIYSTQFTYDTFDITFL